MTITNETIINAARAAGLKVSSRYPTFLILERPSGLPKEFDPLNNDTDNAMIRRGAEIDVGFWWERKDSPASVDAIAWIGQPNGHMQDIAVNVPLGADKARAEREAVILCAAAKWDAMQGEIA